MLMHLFWWKLLPWWIPSKTCLLFMFILSIIHVYQEAQCVSLLANAQTSSCFPFMCLLLCFPFLCNQQKKGCTVKNWQGSINLIFIERYLEIPTNKSLIFIADKTMQHHNIQFCLAIKKITSCKINNTAIHCWLNLEENSSPWLHNLIQNKLVRTYQGSCCKEQAEYSCTS